VVITGSSGGHPRLLEDLAGSPGAMIDKVLVE